jgi:Ca2+-binding RTX toxin-like protein
VIDYSSSNVAYSIQDDGGNDEFYLGSGDDVINSYNGSKIIRTGAGDDYIHSNYTSANIDGEAGNDTIYYQGNINDTFTILGGLGDDIINSYSSNQNPNSGYIDGGEGNDKINNQWGNFVKVKGGEGDDIITTSLRQSEIYGDDGNDVIELNDSATSNIVDGGLGDDIIIIRPNSANNTISGGAGADNFVVRESIYTNGTIAATNNIISDFEINNPNEKIDFQFRDISNFSDLRISQNGNDAVITYGSENSTLTVKNINSSQLTPSNFVFKKVGSESNDVINAADLYNKIEAGAGNDIISVIGKENVLYGGAGNDIFTIKKSPNSTTTIKDFSSISAAEKIKFEGFDDLKFSDLLINNTYSYQKGEYRVSLL